MFENEEVLTEDVVSLRNLLRLTDVSLQSVRQKLRWAVWHAVTHAADSKNSTAELSKGQIPSSLTFFSM